jgi:hypothetical protein
MDTTNTFKHSGALGDLIYSLPTMRALGGGILYLDPAGGKDEPLIKDPRTGKTRTPFTAQIIESVIPLLLLQDYIHEVRLWSGEKITYNLDRFRSHLDTGNLCDAHLHAFDLPLFHKDTAWLKVDRPVSEPGYTIVINRTVRYQGNHAFWEHALPKIHRVSLFVGWPKEHDIFEYTFGFAVRYYPTPTVLDVARIIAGSTQFIGNASSANAIAEGLKKNKVLEVYRPAPNVIFNRPGAVYV